MTDIKIKAEKLARYTIAKYGIEGLTQIQKSKFIEACKKVFNDNSNGSFEEQVHAAKIHLHYIINHPDANVESVEVKN